MTENDYDAQISRAKTCMENATDEQDRAAWNREFLSLVAARNAARTPEDIAELERARGLR